MASQRRLRASEAGVERIASAILNNPADGMARTMFKYNDERNDAIADAVSAARYSNGLDDAQADYLKGILRDAIPRVAE